MWPRFSTSRNGFQYESFVPIGRMRTLRQIVLVVVVALSALALNASCEELIPNLAPANTSASGSFAGSANGNLDGETSVSNVNIHTLLYPGHTTKVLAHYLPWWGGAPRSAGVPVRYRSGDPRQALRTFKDMQARGVDGVIVDWYGQNDPALIDEAWRASMPEFAKTPDLTFSIMVDSGTFKSRACKACDVTQTIVSQLDYMARVYFSSRQYLRYNGHPVVFEFGMDWVGKVDWPRIQAAHPEISWVHIHREGFDRDDSKGAFVWIAPAFKKDKPRSPDLSQLREFYRYALTEPTKIATGGVFKGFDDSLADWGKQNPHYTPQLCGDTWLQTFELVNENFSATRQLPFLQLITWNDYEEGTALETGIDNCAALTVRRSGRALTVTLSHATTVDHLELYEKDATGFRLMNRFPSTTSVIQLPEGATGSFYLKAVGKPFFKNVVSSAIVVEAPR